MSPRPTTGYSGTPLAQKLGVKPGMQLLVLSAPVDYRAWLDPLPTGVRFVRAMGPHVDIAHLFTASADELGHRLFAFRGGLRNDAALWVSWPKRASKVTTSISEDVIRDLALPLGFVDVKVCAVDATWSGLKLVVRKELRDAAASALRKAEDRSR